MSTTIIARFQPRPGTADSVERILRGMIAPTRGEPGCQRYDLYRTGSVETAGYCLIERYADEAAVQAHRETVHYKAYRASIMDLLAQPIDVALLTPLDVDGC
jgi:quinol monooxygenase YgiN